MKRYTNVPMFDLDAAGTFTCECPCGCKRHTGSPQLIECDYCAGAHEEEEGTCVQAVQ